MKARYVIAAALLCGCTTLSKPGASTPSLASTHNALTAAGIMPAQVAPQAKVALVLKDCDEVALHAYPVLKKLIPRGQVSPTVVCKLTDIIRCDEQPVQTVTEVDSNERARKVYLMECLRTKLSVG